MEDLNSWADLDQKSILCNSIAVNYQNTVEHDKARFYFLQSIHFAKERIEKSNGWNDPQNNYDFAFLYKNIAVFETSTGNHNKAIKYLEKAEFHYKKLKQMLSPEDYNQIIVGFYDSNITLAFHSGNFSMGETYLKKTESIINSSDWPLSKKASINRIRGEFLSSQELYEEAEVYFLKALSIIDQINDKVDINEHQYVHSLVAAKFHGEKYQEVIDFFAQRQFYKTIEEVKKSVDKNLIKNFSTYVNNLFICSFAHIKMYEATEDIVSLEKSFQWQQLAFQLAEENILENNSEKLSSVLVNPKNKVLSLMKTLTYLVNANKVNEEGITDALRIIDIYKSMQLNLERTSYAENKELWKQEKELKHELNFVNLKIKEASTIDLDKEKLDSLRKLSYKLSLKLQDISSSTKSKKILDEYRIGQNGFKRLLAEHVHKTNENILTYVCDAEFDSLFIIGFNTDTNFIIASEIPPHFISDIKVLYNLNAHLQYSEDNITQQKELNKSFYHYCFEPVLKYLNSSNILIYPIDEMSYISFEALINDENKYLIQDHNFHYTSSLFSVISSRTNESETSSYSYFHPSNYGTDSLAYLFNAKEEVNEVQQILGGEILEGSEATKSHFLELAKKVKIVHIASHSILNFERPYESYIIFDAQKDSGDNKLYAYEIFSQTLNSELVVLSSCNSAQGRIEDGIGTVSLANAFYFAGAPATISSLWSAQDKSSSEIMITFYQELSQGQNKSESLRSAKLTYLTKADKIKSQPFFWANYVLYGNDDPLFEKEEGTNLWKHAIVFGLVVSLFFIGKRFFI